MAPESPNIGRCASCGVIGHPHASDAECISALRVHIAQFKAFVVSLTKRVA